VWRVFAFGVLRLGGKVRGFRLSAAGGSGRFGSAFAR
jgi:hypothetical protein